MYLLSFDPAVPQSWYIPKRNNNSCPHKNWQMDVFSSIIHKGESWKQLKYLSTDGQISKMWYVDRVEYCSSFTEKQNSAIYYNMAEF